MYVYIYVIYEKKLIYFLIILYLAYFSYWSTLWSTLWSINIETNTIIIAFNRNIVQSNLNQILY